MDTAPLAYLGKVGFAYGGVEEDRIVEVAHVGDIVHVPAMMWELAASHRYRWWKNLHKLACSVVGTGHNEVKRYIRF
jgi:hypothetical protein